MTDRKREIFRSKALEHYMQGREKVVLPRFISGPVIISLWIFLGLLLIAGGVAWLGRVPTYTSGLGIVATQGAQTTQAALVVVFLPANQRALLHAGEPVQVQLGATGPQLKLAITEVEPNVTSPKDARNRFGLDGATSVVVSQPSAVALVKLNTRIAIANYVGSIVRVRVQIGSERVISLFTGVGSLVGE